MNYFNSLVEGIFEPIGLVAMQFYRTWWPVENWRVFRSAVLVALKVSEETLLASDSAHFVWFIDQVTG